MESGGFCFDFNFLRPVAFFLSFSPMPQASYNVGIHGAIQGIVSGTAIAVGN